VDDGIFRHSLVLVLRHARLFLTVYMLHAHNNILYIDPEGVKMPPINSPISSFATSLHCLIQAIKLSALAYRIEPFAFQSMCAHGTLWDPFIQLSYALEIVP
jgi:hypothetical protein